MGDWLGKALAALPLAAALLLPGEARAEKSILVRSETTATSVSAAPQQTMPESRETVRVAFQPAGTAAAPAADEEEGGAIKLKWRARHPNSFILNHAPQDSQVRQATQLTELNDPNPFNDPFEDRTRRRFTIAQEPGPSEPFRPAPSVDSLVNPPRAGCADCPDQCYNQRACCHEITDCATARDILHGFAINQISLDISPSIDPAAASEEDLQQTKSQRLFQAKSRIWRDIEGNVLAEGNLLDLRYDRVYVATADGETKKFPLATLSDDDRCFVAAWWNVPSTCRLGIERRSLSDGREFYPVTMTWTASQVCHKPLYFEEIALERYGHTTGPIVQPWLSGAHFFANIAFLPYKMGINPLQECQYDLGYYRPGDCAPWLVSPIPLSPRGALFQAGAVVGGSYLIP